MNRAKLPSDAFLAPTREGSADARGWLHQSVDAIVDLLVTASARSPLPRSALSAAYWELAREGCDHARLLEELLVVLAQSMNQANPGYMGHMDPVPCTASIIGELAAAAINNNMLSVEMSPALSRLENGLMGSFAACFGLGEGAGGVMTSGGTLANLAALVVARNRAFPETAPGAMRMQRPLILASEAAHVSLEKAAMIMGLGPGSVIRVPVDRTSRLGLEALSASIDALEEESRRVFCLVGTAGTTTTGSIDPLDQLAELAAQRGLWFHVDAAYGGGLIFSDKHRARLVGIERADSITFNPQKWMYVARTCAMVLFRRRRELEDHFRIGAPYMGSDVSLVNLGEVSIQGTRAADVLKLWCSLRHMGTRGFGVLVDEGCALAEYFMEQVSRRSFLESTGALDTNLVCFRAVRVDRTDEENDEWNRRLHAALLSDAGTFFSLPTYRGKRWLRAVLLNPFTERWHIDKAFARIDRFGASG